MYGRAIANHYVNQVASRTTVNDSCTCHTLIGRVLDWRQQQRKEIACMLPYLAVQKCNPSHLDLSPLPASLPARYSSI